MEMGKKVVLGGYPPLALPNEAKQHADCVVIGYAEGIWNKLLKDFQVGNLKPFYGPNDEYSMENIPPIRHDIITHNPFLGAIQTTRGCQNKC
jgi:radical SAM superfamily enzyme YgiQ (UPF0313 family)